MQAIAEWATAWAAQPPLPFAIGMLALSALALAGLVAGVRYFQRARLIEDTPTATARGAALGYVELQGVAEAMDGAPTHAPLSGLACVWYRYRVEARSDDRYQTWHTVESGTSGDVFWLRDATGRVAIDPDRAEVSVHRRERWAGGIRAASPLLHASLTQAERFRYTEERLHAGDTLYALGTLRAIAPLPPAADASARARELLREWKRDQAALHARFDLNRDGRIDAHEWQAAEVAALATAAREPVPTFDAARDAPINVLGASGRGDRPFILSTHPPTRLRLRYRALALAGSIVALAAGGFALAVMQLR